MKIKSVRQVRSLAAFFIITLLSGCETILPVDDFSLARTAIEAAKSVESAKYSPGYMHKAEVAYDRAVSMYKEHEYEEAREEFRMARLWAEKAENSARLIRFKNGEVL